MRNDLTSPTTYFMSLFDSWKGSFWSKKDETSFRFTKENVRFAKRTCRITMKAEQVYGQSFRSRFVFFCAPLFVWSAFVQTAHGATPRIPQTGGWVVSVFLMLSSHTTLLPFQLSVDPYSVPHRLQFMRRRPSRHIGRSHRTANLQRCS